jgi:hypothetical protein
VTADSNLFDYATLGSNPTILIGFFEYDVSTRGMNTAEVHFQSKVLYKQLQEPAIRIV